MLERLRAAREIGTSIELVLNVCLKSGLPGRLETAIDVLSQLNQALFRFVQERLYRDITEWDLSSERAYRPSDDYWYVLLRSVAQTNVDYDKRYRLIASMRDATTRGMREALVEALGDLGGSRAERLLCEIAKTDSDPFIQRLVTEALEDFDEE